MEKNNQQFLEHNCILDQGSMLQDEYRKILECGYWLESQPLETVEEQSLNLQENEQLIVKTVELSPGEVRYNIKLTKGKQRIQSISTEFFGGLIAGAFALYLYKKYLYLNAQKHTKVQFIQAAASDTSGKVKELTSVLDLEETAEKLVKTIEKATKKMVKTAGNIEKTIEKSTKKIEKTAGYYIEDLYQEYKLEAEFIKEDVQCLKTNRIDLLTEEKITKLDLLKKIFDDEKLLKNKNLANDVVNWFNLEKQLREIDHMGLVNFTKIKPLQPVFNFEQLLTELLAIKGLPAKCVTSLFKHIIAKFSRSNRQQAQFF